GLGLEVFDTCLVDEELVYGCAGIALNMVANNLATTPLLIAANDEQKKEYLGQLVSEPVYAAFALTEPGAGSDAAAISTTYRKVGDDFVLNGTKHFITNGSVAQWYVTFATEDKTQRHGAVSCFVLPAATPGITANRMHNKMGQRASDTAEIVFEDVVVPRSGLIGAEGEGFKIAMRTFDRSRPEVGAFAIGISQRALDESVKYAQQREAFGQAIANFQAIQFMLADMAIELEAMRLLTYKAAWSLDQGAQSSIVSSYAKAFGADRTMQITTNAVQIFGGYGYFSEYPVEKLMRDAKLLQIYEGTSQIQRIIIAKHLLKGA
ncbi:MAG: acyl-CoA dehydrogenase family protein, partial [Gammaproteobacteria bacterium]|nr:acyl-CoA dehydrogenase family protein [Gammaproteobacteria bacterium]